MVYESGLHLRQPPISEIIPFFILKPGKTKIILRFAGTYNILNYRHISAKIEMLFYRGLNLGRFEIYTR